MTNEHSLHDDGASEKENSEIEGDSPEDFDSQSDFEEQEVQKQKVVESEYESDYADEEIVFDQRDYETDEEVNLN